MIRRLTENQSAALEKIKVIENQQFERLTEHCKEHGGTPSRWISKHTLIYTHKINRGIIDALIKKQYLYEKTESGLGKYVKPANAHLQR